MILPSGATYTTERYFSVPMANNISKDGAAQVVEHRIKVLRVASSNPVRI